MPDPIASNSTRRLLLATLLGAASASAILVVGVLPAGYGIDPTGLGRRLGLTKLVVAAPAPEARAPAAGADETPFATDVYEVELRPRESLEYKYWLNDGGSMLYSWKSDSIVAFEFHGEPDGSPPGFAESYAKGEAASGQGVFNKAKAGIHGWFWENKGPKPVKLVLRSAGFYEASIEYRDGKQREKRFQ